MLNLWVTRSYKRKAIADINRLLLAYVGRPTANLDGLLQKMRVDIMNYFNSHPDYAKIFVSGNRLDYRFHIEEFKGTIAKVTFEEKA